MMLAAMGLKDTDGAFRENMSEAAAALMATIDTRLAQLDDAEKAARMATIDAAFPPRSITREGMPREGVGLVLVIKQNGDKTYERYCFYNDYGAWRLDHIERVENEDSPRACRGTNSNRAAASDNRRRTMIADILDCNVQILNAAKGKRKQ